MEAGEVRFQCLLALLCLRVLCARVLAYVCDMCDVRVFRGAQTANGAASAAQSLQAKCVPGGVRSGTRAACATVAACGVV